MRAMLRVRPLLLSAALLCATACAGAMRTGPVDTSARALVVGHIALPDRTIQAVQLYRQGKVYLPPFAPHPSARVMENGDFYFDDLPPGTYFLFRFMAGHRWYSLLNGDRAHNVLMRFEVQPGRVHYVGSFRVTGERDGVLSPGRFRFTRVTQPTRGEILENIRAALEGTGWERRLASRED